MSASGTERESLLLSVAKALALSGGVAFANAGRRAAAGAVTYLVAATLFGVSLCFLTLSGYRAISQSLGEIYASLIVGCAYLFAGLIALLVVQSRRR